MDISSFSLQSATLEVRFEPAYALWDKIGQYWVTLSSKWPKLALVDGGPLITHFVMERKYEVVLEIDKLRIVSHEPETTLKEFLKLSQDVIATAQEYFGIRTYTRIGFRIVYFKKYETKEKSAENFLKLNLIKEIKTKQFNIEGKTLNPECIFNWEDDDLGIRLHLAAVTRTINANAPLGIIEIEPIKIDKTGIQVDIDYYTLKNVTKGQFNPIEWVEKSHQAIRRDISKYLGG